MCFEIESISTIQSKRQTESSWEKIIKPCSFVAQFLDSPNPVNGIFFKGVEKQKYDS
jgi:hypothetical protein